MDEAPTRTPIRSSPVTVLLLAAEPVSDREPLISGWRQVVDQAPSGSQLILIDDDPSSTFADTRCRVVRHVAPLGVGGCLQTGLWVVETPLILMVELDSGFEPSDAKSLFEQIDGADLVAATRRIAKIPTLIRGLDWARRILSRVFLGHFPEARADWPGWAGCGRRWSARHLFGVPLADPEGRMFLARLEAIRRIPVQSRGLFALTELLAKLNHMEGLLAETTIPWSPRHDKATDFWRDAWRLFRDPDFGSPEPTILRLPLPSPAAKVRET